MRLRFCAVVGVWLFSLWATAESWRVGVETEYPPFSYLSERGEIKGFEIELVQALCRELGQPCHLLPSRWVDLLPGLEQGRFDLVIASVSITPERAQRVDFSAPYYQMPVRLLRLQGHPVDASLMGLSDRRIGVQAGTVHERYLEQVYPDWIKLQRFNSVPELVDALHRGEVDAIMADALLLEYQLASGSKNQAQYEFFGPVFSNPRWFGQGIGIALAPGSTERLAAVNRGLQQLEQSGQLDRIWQRYFAVERFAR